jgi:putative oxidoreductase
MTGFLGLPAALAFLAVGAEVFGGIGLILGLFSRIAAAGIGVIMLVGILMVHGKYGLFMNWFGDREGHGYEYHLLAIALVLLIAVKGSGALSLDRLLYISMARSLRNAVDRHRPPRKLNSWLTSASMA